MAMRMLTLRALRWFAFIVPVVFAVGLGLLMDQVLERALSDRLAHIVVGLIVGLAAVIFTFWIFGLLGRMYRQLEAQRDALRESEERLQAILDNTTAVIYVKDTEGRYILINRQYETLFHVDREEVKGKTDYDIFPRENADAFVANDRRVLEAGVPLESEEVAPHDDGPHTYISLKFPLRDSTGAPYAVCGISTDITDRIKLYESERRRAEEWKSLFEMGEEVTASPDQEALLNSVVERASRLLGTDVAALMLLEPDGRELRMGAHQGLRTKGIQRLRLLAEHGLQGLVLETGKPAIVEDYRRDPRLRDRPAKLVEDEGIISAICVPFSVKGRLLGTLSVGSRQPTKFTEQQAELLAAFANWAAVAVETSGLYDRVKSLALLEERDRIGMDLHDGIIQSMYAVGLGLEDAAERLEESPQGARQRLDKAMDDLNKVIRDIRSYIFDLRPQVSEVGDLKGALAELVEELRVNTLMETELQVASELPPLEGQQVLGLFHIAQEALNNVAKHSRATSAQVCVAVNGRILTLEVADNGVGFAPQAQRDKAKNGLRNMMDRARALGARLSIDSAAGKGTRVSLDLPVTETARK